MLRPLMLAAVLLIAVPVWAQDEPAPAPTVSDLTKAKLDAYRAKVEAYVAKVQLLINQQLGDDQKALQALERDVTDRVFKELLCTEGQRVDLSALTCLDQESPPQ